MKTRDTRTDSGQYYPGGRVIARHSVAPQQIVVQWTDVQGKPQISPLPDRHRESDMKGKINEIVSKFATAIAVALVGWTALAGLVVQKAQKDQVWNDEEIVTNVYYEGEIGIDTNAVTNIIHRTVDKAYVESLGISGGGSGGTNTNDVKALINSEVSGTNAIKAALATISDLSSQKADRAELENYIPFYAYDYWKMIDGNIAFAGTVRIWSTWDYISIASGETLQDALNAKADRSEIPTAPEDVGAFPDASGQALQQTVGTIAIHLNAEDAKDVVTNYDSAVNMPSRRLEYKIPDGPDAGKWRVVWDELTRWNWLTGTYLPSNFYTKAEVDARTDNIQWGLFDSQTGNFSPEKTVQISSDRVILCKGASYQRTATAQGSYWVWTSNEPYSITGVESNGYFRIEDAEGNTTFEIVKGDKVTAAATAGGVTTEQVMGITHLHISYPIDADTHPTLEICNSLTTLGWKAETDESCLANVTWTGVSGNYSAEVWGKGVEDTLFVKATYQRGSDPYVRYAQALQLQTVKIGNTIYYVGTATISGHTVITLSLTPPAQ